MNVLVTGATGMLGREVVNAASTKTFSSYGIEWVVPVTHGQLDITDAAAVRHRLKESDAQVVINCAGLTKHVGGFPDDFRRVNTLGPLMLAQECDRVGARLIHVSTDCVFSGTRPIEDGPYTEADKPDATDIYGESKAFGEVIGAPHLTVRCSFVGNSERGLIAGIKDWYGMHTMGDPMPLWAKSWWSGSTAPAIARALVELAQQPHVTGVMHLTTGMCITKADLIEAIWLNGAAPRSAGKRCNEPRINRWLATIRDDAPALPPLDVALRELAGG